MAARTNERKPAVRNPIAKALRARGGGVHVAVSADTRPKAMRKLVGAGSYRRSAKGSREAVRASEWA